MAAAATSGIGGEKLIAVLNNRYDVYVVQSAEPACAAVIVVDPLEPQSIMVADVGSYSDVSKEQRRHAGTIAAQALQEVLTDLHIVPS